jgi:hypothetical protein
MPDIPGAPWHALIDTREPRGVAAARSCGADDSYPLHCRSLVVLSRPRAAP